MLKARRSRILVNDMSGRAIRSFKAAISAAAASQERKTRRRLLWLNNDEARSMLKDRSATKIHELKARRMPTTSMVVSALRSKAVPVAACLACSFQLASARWRFGVRKDWAAARITRRSAAISRHDSHAALRRDPIHSLAAVRRHFLAFESL